MSCTRPLLVRRTPSGEIKILNRDKFSIFEAEKFFGKDNVFFVPCGKCPGCVLAKRKEYAIRCAMESKYHEDNCFITLTYDEVHCPKKLVKAHLQKFIKSIRNKGYQVRYFGCGEYGSINKRPHYHIILFGFRPFDMKYLSDSPSGEALFSSELIDSLWSYGLNVVQEFSPAAAGYVAGYVNKKFGVEDSFLLMSKRPGLGYQYLKEHASEIADEDVIIDDFGTFKRAHAPRYFDKIAENIGVNLSKTKEKRIEACSMASAGEMFLNYCTREELTQLKEKENLKKLSKLERNL